MLLRQLIEPDTLFFSPVPIVEVCLHTPIIIHSVCLNHFLSYSLLQAEILFLFQLLEFFFSGLIYLLEFQIMFLSFSVYNFLKSHGKLNIVISGPIKYYARFFVKLSFFFIQLKMQNCVGKLLNELEFCINIFKTLYFKPDLITPLQRHSEYVQARYEFILIGLFYIDEFIHTQ